MEQSLRATSSKAGAAVLIFTFFFPFFGLLLSLYYWRKSWAKNVFWLACMFMGAIQVYCPEGAVLGAGADGGRYVLELMESGFARLMISNTTECFWKICRMDPPFKRRCKSV